MILQHDIASYAVTSIGCEGTLATEWTYDSSDPAAVKILFKQSDPVTWVISRDLFILGLISEQSVGDGDVHVQADGPWFRIFLDAGSDLTACVRLLASDVQAFIDESLDIVESDEENQSVADDLDDALAMILSEGA